MSDSIDDCSTFTVRSSPGATLSFVRAVGNHYSNYDDVSCTMTLKYPPSNEMAKELRFKIKTCSRTFRYLARPSSGVVRQGKGVIVNLLLSEKDKRVLFGPCAEESALQKFRHEMADSLVVTWETPDGRDAKTLPCKDKINLTPTTRDHPASIIVTLRHPESNPSSSKNYIAFKVMTNKLRHYKIHPAHGIMKPGSIKTIQITLIEEERQNILDSLDPEGCIPNFFTNDKIAILSQPVRESFAKNILNKTAKYEAMASSGPKKSNLQKARKELFIAFIAGWDTIAKSRPHAVSKNKITIQRKVASNSNDTLQSKENPVIDVVLGYQQQQHIDEALPRKKNQGRRKRKIGRPHNRGR